MFIVILIFLLFGAVWMDFKETRIPNTLILFGLISGMLYHLMSDTGQGFLLVLFGIFLPIIVFFPLFMIGAMGAGDIKLLAVTGSFFSIGENVKCIGAAIVIGGIIGLFKLIFHKRAQKKEKVGIRFSLPVFIGATLVMGGIL